ncbi:MAG: PQQ-like beta-propeller repeat protein [Bdellovibrionales bacterium]|nr:PQQ-like beta-propeller repeat protein [Bdellovibrionales bacterium]
MIQRFLNLFIFCLFFLSWNWEKLSLKKESPKLSVKTHWIVDTVENEGLRRSFINNTSPLVTKKWVLSGNSIDGVKAYDKKSGRLIWSFSIPGGLSKPLVLNRDKLYFGGKDGFFYSLDLETGSLEWKYYISSELAGQPLIEEGRIYFLTENHKLYSLDLKGRLVWLASHSISNEAFMVKGNFSPIVIGNKIYFAFQDGFVKAFKKETADLLWKVKLSSQPILSVLGKSKNCLLVPVFNEHLYCLNPENGKVMKKVEGGFASIVDENSGRIYQSYKKTLLAYKIDNFQFLWKKKLKAQPAFAPSLFKDYLVYGFPSLGELQIRRAKDGSFVNEYLFGKGLAGFVSVDSKDNSLYFLSVDSYLHKISFY